MGVGGNFSVARPGNNDAEFMDLVFAGLCIVTELPRAVVRRSASMSKLTAKKLDGLRGFGEGGISKQIP